MFFQIIKQFKYLYKIEKRLLLDSLADQKLNGTYAYENSLNDKTK